MSSPQFDKHIVQEIEALDSDTVCAYQDCGHTLGSHESMDVTTYGDAGVEKAIYPCVSVNMATRGVCACRNFEKPVTVNPAPVQPVPVTGLPPVVTSTIFVGVRLNFHEGGSLSWDRIPGVEVP